MRHGVEIQIPGHVYIVFIIERLAKPSLTLDVDLGSPAWAAAGDSPVDILFPDDLREKLLSVHVRPELSECDDPSPGRAMFVSGDLLLLENWGGEFYDLIQVPPGSYAFHFEKSAEVDDLNTYALTLFDRQPVTAGHNSGPSTVM